MSREKTNPRNDGRISILGEYIRPLRLNTDNIIIKISTNCYRNSLVLARSLKENQTSTNNSIITDQNSVLIPEQGTVLLTGRKLDDAECLLGLGTQIEEGEGAIDMDIEEFCRAADVYKQ